MRYHHSITKYWNWQITTILQLTIRTIDTIKAPKNETALIWYKFWKNLDEMLVGLDGKDVLKIEAKISEILAEFFENKNKE